MSDNIDNSNTFRPLSTTNFYGELHQSNPYYQHAIPMSACIRVLRVAQAINARRTGSSSSSSCIILNDLAAKPIAQLILNDKHGKWPYDTLRMSRLPKKEVMIKVLLDAQYGYSTSDGESRQPHKVMSQSTHPGKRTMTIAKERAVEEAKENGTVKTIALAARLALEVKGPAKPMLTLHNIQQPETASSNPNTTEQPPMTMSDMAQHGTAVTGTEAAPPLAVPSPSASQPVSEVGVDGTGRIIQTTAMLNSRTEGPPSPINTTQEEAAPSPTPLPQTTLRKST
ncbi:hypothetical protein M422DRAFT_242135 [Sphaerobolus stellatus SS14]|nr:hypothetical protein M422DRAFT_242135 [Sphaerobolus stellatus SS14]